MLVLRLYNRDGNSSLLTVTVQGFNKMLLLNCLNVVYILQSIYALKYNTVTCHSFVAIGHVLSNAL
jgi:hypothetical protein